MTGMKNYDTGMLDDSTGMLDDNTGMLEEDAGLIDEGSGLIMENDSEDTLSGRRKRSRERGKDLKSRNFPLHTLKNLPQFRNKSHEEVRQYILEKKGVDIGINVNWNKTIMWIFVAIAIVIGGIGLAKWLQQKQERKTMCTC